MRYRLRTLLILLAVLPPLLWLGWTKYEAWKAEQARRAALSKQKLVAPQSPIYVTETGPIPQMVLPPGTHVTETATAIPRMVLPPGTQINTVPMPPTPAPTPAPIPSILLIPSPIKPGPLNRP